MGFLAEPRPAAGYGAIACPNCSGTLLMGLATNRDPEESIWICSCGWESKWARQWKRIKKERVLKRESLV